MRVRSNLQRKCLTVLIKYVDPNKFDEILIENVLSSL